jgi:hypothetical protein
LTLRYGEDGGGLGGSGGKTNVGDTPLDKGKGTGTGSRGKQVSWDISHGGGGGGGGGGWGGEAEPVAGPGIYYMCPSYISSLTIKGLQ